MIDEMIPYRIKKIYASSTPREKVYLKAILEEIAETGDSPTYRDIWLSDYLEIPVDIDTFLCDDYYLGKVTRNGKAIYPFWRDFMRKLFYAGNKYEETFFTGATRIGKTSTAITCTAYMLYKLMCLRDPQEYFQKKDVSVFSILFFNLTKELAGSVAYREFTDTILASPWFLEHGKKMGSDKNPYYVPDGDKVIITYGSDAAHALGQQVFCVVGNTKILTSDGYHKIEDLAGTTACVGQHHDGCIYYSDAEIKLTDHVYETIRVTLEDGTVFEGTPDHPVMLTDGSYKRLGDLSSSDDVFTLNIDEVNFMNLKDRAKPFVVYKHTSPSNKVYIGITCDKPEKRWGKNGSGYYSNKHFKNAIFKYGWENFKHEIVATDLTIDEASEEEKRLVALYNASDPNYGYNGTEGGEIGFPSEETREKLRQSTTNLWKNPEFRNKVCSSLMSHSFSEEARKKLSKSQHIRMTLNPPPWKGKPRSPEHSRKIAEKLRGRPPWNKCLTKEDHEGIMRYAIKLKRPHSEEHRKKQSSTVRQKYIDGYSPIWINNGEYETLIDSSTTHVPEGFVKGRLDLDFTYIHRPDTDEENRVPAAELDYYLSDGWVLGHSKHRCEGIRRSLQKYYWVYEGVRYEKSEDLAAYLRNNGYPKIVSSTITDLYNKGFSKSKIYSSLDGKIQRVEVER